MTPVFADTFFYLALLIRNDNAHARAVAASENRRGRFLTTEWILTEVADALCTPPHRQQFILLLEPLKADPDTEIVPAASPLFVRGAELYAHRPDESWSLTDCMSFVVMTEHGVTEALTGDRHFEQAGFRPLLSEA
jgi:predicted nucleic acid-binding protein